MGVGVSINERRSANAKRTCHIQEPQIIVIHWMCPASMPLQRRRFGHHISSARHTAAAASSLHARRLWPPCCVFVNRKRLSCFAPDLRPRQVWTWDPLLSAADWLPGFTSWTTSAPLLDAACRAESHSRCVSHQGISRSSFACRSSMLMGMSLSESNISASLWSVRHVSTMYAVILFIKKGYERNGDSNGGMRPLML